MSNRRTKETGATPSSFKGEFSFVNKDASNIDSKDHNSAVSWHVMNRYEKWKKQEQARKLRASAKVPVSAGPSAESSYSLHEEDAAVAPYPPEPWQIDNAEQSMLSHVEPGPLSHLRTHAQGYASLPQSSDTISAPTTTANSPQQGSNLQKGSSLTAEFPPLVTGILSYAYGNVVPITWPSENANSKWEFEISRTWDDLVAINEDPCYASATLCFYATLMATSTNDRDLASQACFFQAQAMAELRQRVADRAGPYNVATMKAILRLFSAETALDNTSTARVHLKMLRNIVTSKGGVLLLDSWFRENLLAADCYFALKYETRPLFPVNEWTPGPLNQAWKARLASANILNEHSPSINSTVEHPVLRSVMIDLRELFKVEQYTEKHEVAADDQLLRWRQLRKYDCINRLADHQLSVKIYPHLYIRPNLQLAVCTGVALMTALVMGSPEPVRFGLKLLGELRSKVMVATEELSLNQGISQAEEDLNPEDALFWLLYIGMLGEKTHPVPAHGVWFQTEFASVAQRLGYRTVEEQHGVVRKFLYSAALFEEVSNERSYRNVETRKGVYEACGMSWRKPIDAGAAEQ